MRNEFLLRNFKKTLVFCLIIFSACLSSHVYAENYCADQDKNKFLKEKFACYFDTLSWVEVRFQGDVLKKHKLDYEKLIRLRVRNDMSSIKHETIEFSDAMKKYKYDLKSPELRRRGTIGCYIWTVGKDYPIAKHIECKLSGYGVYEIPLEQEFKSESLSYSSAANADEQTREILRGLVVDIASDFYESRDR